MYIFIYIYMEKKLPCVPSIPVFLFTRNIYKKAELLHVLKIQVYIRRGKMDLQVKLKTQHNHPCSILLRLQVSHPKKLILARGSLESVIGHIPAIALGNLQRFIMKSDVLLPTSIKTYPQKVQKWFLSCQRHLWTTLHRYKEGIALGCGVFPKQQFHGSLVQLKKSRNHDAMIGGRVQHNNIPESENNKHYEIRSKTSKTPPISISKGLHTTLR